MGFLGVDWVSVSCLVGFCFVLCLVCCWFVDWFVWVLFGGDFVFDFRFCVLIGFWWVGCFGIGWFEVSGLVLWVLAVCSDLLVCSLGGLIDVLGGLAVGWVLVGCIWVGFGW